MKVLLDTSVLVPAVVEWHVNHAASYPWLKRVRDGGIELALSAHSLAESYNVLTTLPGAQRIPPPTAAELVEDLVSVAGSVVDLATLDYRNVITRQASLWLAGGAIYDALIARAAQKAKVDKLLTFNMDHFLRVWPEGKRIICTP